MDPRFWAVHLESTAARLEGAWGGGPLSGLHAARTSGGAVIRMTQGLRGADSDTDQ